MHLPWHTAKSPPNSACDHCLLCANTLAHGKEQAFVVCFCQGTRQTASLCHVPGRESTWQRACATSTSNFCRGPEKAHGKGWLYRCLFAVCPLPCAAHDKSFAVCFLGFAVCHTANTQFSVVIIKIRIPSENLRGKHEGTQMVTG